MPVDDDTAAVQLHPTAKATTTTTTATTTTQDDNEENHHHHPSIDSDNNNDRTTTITAAATSDDGDVDNNSDNNNTNDRVLLTSSSSQGDYYDDHRSSSIPQHRHHLAELTAARTSDDYDDRSTTVTQQQLLPREMNDANDISRSRSSSTISLPPPHHQQQQHPELTTTTDDDDGLSSSKGVAAVNTDDTNNVSLHQGHPTLLIRPRYQPYQQQQPSIVASSSSSSSHHHDVPSSSSLGTVVTAVLVVRDWGQYGFVQRVAYHYRQLIRSSSTRTIATASSSSRSPQPRPSSEPTTIQSQKLSVEPPSEENSGIVRLLECVTTKATSTSRQQQQQQPQRQPKREPPPYHDDPTTTTAATLQTKQQQLRLPQLSPQSRLYFTYEVTRMAYILDASPTLTATFGHTTSTTSSCLCPMDRFVQMTRTFWTALCQPIAYPHHHHHRQQSQRGKQLLRYQPEIAVTVLAVFPRQQGQLHNKTKNKNHSSKATTTTTTTTSILVRDYRVSNVTDAETLIQKIEEWCRNDVETTIAQRMSHQESHYGYNDIDNDDDGDDGDMGILPLYQSHMEDLLTAGYAAVSTLSNIGRPTLVIATDGRAVVSQQQQLRDNDDDSLISNTLQHLDTPVTILDLSNHPPPPTLQQQQEQQCMTTSSGDSWLNWDPDGGNFPLHLWDNDNVVVVEALYRLCRSTGGVYMNESHLTQAAVVKAGPATPVDRKRTTTTPRVGPNATSSSAFQTDLFFTFKRHNIHPNAIQWYILFALSPLTPILQDTWGTLSPPEYITQSLMRDPFGGHLVPSSLESNMLNRSRHLAVALPPPAIPVVTNVDGKGRQGVPRKSPRARTTFATYFINPIPILEIILTRVKEGYRAKHCSVFNNAGDSNRISIQFILPVDYDITVSYEVSHQALAEDMTINGVGFASIKIELSGDASLIAIIKNDYVNSQSAGGRGKPTNMLNRISDRLIAHVHGVRKADLLLSYLSPLKWTDQLSSSETPFVRRLGSLSSLQRKRHFSVDEFDCVCTGRMPWDEDDFLSEFRDPDIGIRQLIDAVAAWSTQTITKGSYYVRQTDTGCDVGGYCTVEIVPSAVTTRLYTVVLETFGGIKASTKSALMQSLCDTLTALRCVEVLDKQIGKFLVGDVARSHTLSDELFNLEVLESHHNHVTWDLVKDAELLPLLMRRRREIGKFYLLESSENSAFFAKLYESNDSDDGKDPGNLAQYGLVVLEDKVVVDLHMESESGAFFPFRAHKLSQPVTTKFHRLQQSLKTRDQECGHALQCRTALLRALESSDNMSNSGLSYLTSVERLLGYASKVVLRLRFFHSGSGSANQILKSLTVDALLSQSFGARVASLPIPTDASVQELCPGSWFIVEYDKHTMSIVHLSDQDISEESPSGEHQYMCRQLTFFTIGVSDLYNRRDDIIDDDAFDDDHISEHLQVTEFSDSIVAAHDENYCVAAYRALQSGSNSSVDTFDPDDFAEVMKRLDFVEVSSAVIAGADRDSNDGPNKLKALFQPVLHAIKGVNGCLFYESSDEYYEYTSPFQDDSVSRSDADDGNDEDDDESANCDEEGSLASTSSNEMRGSVASAMPDSSRQSQPAPPIFARFLADGAPISLDDFSHVNKSTKLSVLISVFPHEGSASHNRWKADRAQLDPSHKMAALNLSALASAFVAEQTLERLEQQGNMIADDDIMVAKRCLGKARSTVRSIIDVFFYVEKSDSMVAASAPEGATAEVDEGFTLLDSELRASEKVALRRFSRREDFLVALLGNSIDSSRYWCFLRVRRPEGIITVDIYHPSGSEKASELLDAIWSVISLCCHRVNQFLLLRKLHNSRSASKLLIPPDSITQSRDSEDKPVDVGRFSDGVFECDTVYQTTFDLYHRCAASPGHVVRLIEASVLHIFSVNNRRQVFVYRDESGAVFYMRLSAVERESDLAGGSDATAQIHLLVYGVVPPGPSITQQLRTLLQKRLLLISVEMFSNVLTKNPQFHWKPLDVSFIKSFQAEWDKLDVNSPSVSNKRRTYAFPASAYDPGMITLFFRQNLCGSTFFHPLSVAASSNNNESSHPGHDGNLQLATSDLTFYYNASPSKLDADFQSESTLTAKGALYSREAGAGIAMVAVSLLGSRGNHLQELHAAIPPSEYCYLLDVSQESLHFREMRDEVLHDDSGDGNISFVQVDICDTALNTDTIHEWILLSLTQAHISWIVERQIEKMQCAPLAITLGSQSTHNRITDDLKRREVDKLCCGLPDLISVLNSADELPHPAVLRQEYEGVIRSSSVASVALDLLKEGVLDQVQSEAKLKLVAGKQYKLIIVRSSRSATPRLVELERDEQQQVNIRVLSTGTDEVSFIKDSAIDCPEYTILFFSLDYMTGDEYLNRKTFPKLFEEVTVGYAKSGDKGDYAKSLFGFKSRNLPYFKRSFAFIFSVKRNRRTLTAYNWSPSLFKRTSMRLRDMDSGCLSSSNESVSTLQNRCMGMLAPLRSPSTPNMPKAKLTRSNSSRQQTAEMDGHGDEAELKDLSRPPRPQATSQTPFIRRPKLVGKSIEGSAVQAVARSRARASSARMRVNHPISSNASTRQPTGVGSAIGSRSPSPRVVARKVSNPRLPPKASDSVQMQETDRDVVLARNQVAAALKRQTCPRAPRAQIVQDLTSTHWPRKQTQTLSFPLAEYIFSLGALSWHEFSDMLPHPSIKQDDFLLSLGQTLCSWTTDLTRVTIQLSGPLQRGCCLLVGKTRYLRSFKGFVAVKLTTEKLLWRGETKIVVSSEGRILTLPRRKKDVHLLKARTTIEHCSAGLDQLALDLRSLVRLQGKLFDYAAYLIERTMKSTVTEGGVETNCGDVYQILRQLIEMYPRKTIMQTPRSIYKCYEAKIALGSFGDRLIDLFDGPSLFQWLVSHASDRNLVVCRSVASSSPTEGGLCFPAEIVVAGTYSTCFLRCSDSMEGNANAGNDTEPKSSRASMKLCILCRTQGRNIQEFMFRPGSNVAISIMANIAVEAAGLAHKELHWAAASLRRETLWTKFSGREPSIPPGSPRFLEPLVTNDDSSQNNLSSLGYELLQLCSVRSASSVLEHCSHHRLATGFHRSSNNIEIMYALIGGRTPSSCTKNNNATPQQLPSCLMWDPHRCLQCLQNDPAFAPSWDWNVRHTPLETCHKYMFYVDSADAFLLITTQTTRNGTTTTPQPSSLSKITATKYNSNVTWEIEVVEHDGMLPAIVDSGATTATTISTPPTANPIPPPAAGAATAVVPGGDKVILSSSAAAVSALQKWMNFILHYEWSEICHATTTMRRK